MKVESAAAAMAPVRTTEKTTGSLKQAAQEFEAFFLNQMFKQMRQSMPAGGLFEPGPQEKMMLEMMDEQVAAQLSRGPGMGLSQVLLKQLQQSQS